MKALTWPEQQARILHKEALSCWGKGWRLLSREQKENALAFELVRLMNAQCEKTLESNPALRDIVHTWRQLVREEFP